MQVKTCLAGNVGYKNSAPSELEQKDEARELRSAD